MKLACALGVFFAVAGLLEAAPPRFVAPSAQPAVQKKDGTDVMTRRGRAQQLTRDGKFAEAAEEYAWLWQHMLDHDPASRGVRVSFMAGEMQLLAARSPEAKQKFIALRDETTERLKVGVPDAQVAADWAALNSIVGDQGATLEWYETVKGDPQWQPALGQVAGDFEGALAERGRWGEIAGLHQDPIKVVETLHTVALRAPGGRPEPKAGEQTLQYQGAAMLRARSGLLYAGLLAAGREQEGQALAARARELDPSFAMMRGLVAAAVRAGEARPEHVAWYQDQGKEIVDDAAMAALGRAVVYESSNELRAALERSGKMPAR